MKIPWKWYHEVGSIKTSKQIEAQTKAVCRLSDSIEKMTKILKRIKPTIMENMLRCNGRRFTAKIMGTESCGKIRVEGGDVFLCQNENPGSLCRDRLGYKYSWAVGSGVPAKLIQYNVTDFKLIDMTAEEIEAFKDWRIGDRIEDKAEGCVHGSDMEVIFRSGELVVCKFTNSGKATSNFTVDELYERGYRLVAEPAPEEETIVEVTMDEIAQMKGVPVERLRVKKEE